MGNQEVREFMTRTEQNIAGTQISIDESLKRQTTDQNPAEDELINVADLNQSLKYRLLRFGSLLFIPLCGLIYLLHPMQVKNNLVSQMMVDIRPQATLSHTRLALKAQPILVSKIPSWRIAATRQFLYPISLRKANLALLKAYDADTALEQLTPLMDKVLVIPKSFG